MPFSTRDEKGRPVTVKDEGITLTTNVSSIDMTGAGVTATAVGNDVTEAIGGTVSGPGTSTDNAIARFDGTTGKIVQNSLVTIDDTGHIFGIDGTALLPTYSFASDPDTGFYWDSPNDGVVWFGSNGAQAIRLAGNSLWVAADTASLRLGTSADTFLFRDAANTFAQRNGTTAQSFRVYNTFTDSSNYERLLVGIETALTGANVFGIITTKGGTGTGRPLLIGTAIAGNIRFITNGVENWNITGNGHLIATGGDNTFDIGASGATRPRNLYVGTSIRSTAYNGTSDGIVLMWNAAGTDFSRLQLGGTTSSFPAIKRSGATIAFRLADDSADAGITAAGQTWSGNSIYATDNTYDIGASGATRPRSLFLGSNITAGGAIQLGASNILGWAGVSRMVSSTDGIIVLYNNALSDFTRLQFGGTTSSFPSIKRSSAALVFRLADDSADAAITAANITSSGYFIRTVGTTLSAAGTTRTDALQLSKQVNNVTTAAAGTGVILPVGVIGMRITIFNAGANAMKVYASGSETIDGTAGSTGVTLTNAKRCDYFMVAANTWISAQLGVTSA